jgi:Omp85 superfamily domain
VSSQSLVAAIAITLVLGTYPARASAQSTATSASAPAQVTAPAETRGLFAEPRALVKGLEFAGPKLDGPDGGDVKSGFYPELGNMVTGAGWISPGVGYRHLLFNDRALFDVSSGISWRLYKMAQARFELTSLAQGRVAVGTLFRWQDLAQITYYGEGPNSREEDRSEYRLKSVNQIGYVTLRPFEWMSLEGRLGWLGGPNLRQPGGAFLRGNPSTDEMFPADPVYQMDEQPDYLYGEAIAIADTRDEPGYPTRGGFYRAVWTRYSDREAGSFSFERYEGEAVHFVPLAESNVVIGLHGWVVGTTTPDGQHVPFYLMPSLGGNNTLRGFADYRFHDRNLVAVNAETRVAIFEHIDAVAFMDAGNVAARWSDLNLDRTSLGVAVRVHGQHSTYARFEVAHSNSEGWHIVFRMNDPFGYSRLRKRSAQVPFAP